MKLPHPRPTKYFPIEVYVVTLKRSPSRIVALLVIAVLLSFVAASASTMFSYDVHNDFKAAFPGSPSFFGEAGMGQATVRSYQYHDHAGMLVYSSNATQERLRFRERDIDTAIRNWIKGDVASVNGELELESVGKVNGIRGATYRFTYRLHGIPILKCSAVIFHNGRFVSWTVQGSPGISAKDPCRVFNGYVSHFGSR